MTIAHPAYVALGLSSIGILLVVTGFIVALKPALHVSAHTERIADNALFLQMASLQMQFERLSHVGAEVEPLAMRARAAVAAMRSDVADSGLADVARGARASIGAIRHMIDTFR